MKLMKSGYPGQILGSMRVPELWLLISTGSSGEVCATTEEDKGGHLRSLTITEDIININSFSIPESNAVMYVSFPECVETIILLLK